MVGKISRINLSTPQGSLVYLTGGKSLKDQRISIISAHDLFLPMEDVSVLNAPYELSDRESVQAAKQCARHLSSVVAQQFMDVQGLASSRIKNTAPCHGFLSFAPDDINRLEDIARERTRLDEVQAKKENRRPKRITVNDVLKEVSHSYMKKMGLSDTLYLVTRHYDTNNIHLHFAFSYVQPDGTAVPIGKWTNTSNKACDELEQEYGLTRVHNLWELRKKAEDKARREGKSESDAKRAGQAVPRYHDKNYKRDESKTNPAYLELLKAKDELKNLLKTSTSFEAYVQDSMRLGYEIKMSTKHDGALIIGLPSGTYKRACDVDRSLTYKRVMGTIRKNGDGIKTPVPVSAKTTVRNGSGRNMSPLSVDANLQNCFTPLDKRAVEKAFLARYNFMYRLGANRAVKASLDEKRMVMRLLIKKTDKTFYQVGVSLYDGRSVTIDRKGVTKVLQPMTWVPSSLEYLSAGLSASASGFMKALSILAQNNSVGASSIPEGLPRTEADIVDALIEAGMDPNAAEKAAKSMHI